MKTDKINQNRGSSEKLEETARRDAKEKLGRRIQSLYLTVYGNHEEGALPDSVKRMSAPWEAISESASLYEAALLGSTARYFDMDALARYLDRKILFGAEEEALLSMALLCLDSAVWKRISDERPGIPDMRRAAFQDILELDQRRLTHTPWGSLEAAYLSGCMEQDFAAPPNRLVQLIHAAEKAETTSGVIDCIDRLYRNSFEKGFADFFKGFGELNTFTRGTDDGPVAGREDQEEEEIVLNLETSKLAEEDGKKDGTAPSDIVIDDESMARVADFIEQNYGKSFLTGKEQDRLEKLLCTGSHQDCRLHFTEGLLTGDFAEETYQMEYAAKMKADSLKLYEEHRLVTRQSILELAGIFKNALMAREERERFSSEYGTICVSKLWNLNRTGNRKLFEREFTQEDACFAVDLLIDASGSQQIRQSLVALQGYIISEALSLAKIPHRVTSFCTFGDYTVLRRFRDYDDGPEKNMRIFEYYGSANNRDGLAVRAAADGLLQRSEENKILIVLSDGMPNDIIVSRSRSDGRPSYSLAYAVRDTAGEVRALRNRGIKVMGIFVGDEDALPDERTVFGNSFAYIRSIEDFSNVAGRYLRGELTD